MKVKVSESSGPVLDYLVAKCEGMKPYWDENREDFAFDPSVYLCWLSEFKPSTDWAQGGPIIEREEIELRVLPNSFTESEHLNFLDGDSWEANIWPADRDAIACCGTSPLIAALRCYVVSKLDEEVEVPERLL